MDEYVKGSVSDVALFVSKQLIEDGSRGSLLAICVPSVLLYLSLKKYGLH